MLMTPNKNLARVVGVPGAVLMGLGSILGTGVFVSIGIAAGVTGPYVILAVALAAAVATFNGLSSAQLAASHPVSGGTYEYGHRYLNPTLGFVAGWMFLCAKSASAATAALGLAGYLLGTIGHAGMTERVVVALVVVGLLTAVVASGMRQSNRTNVVFVSITLVALLAFVVAGLPSAIDAAPTRLGDLFAGDGDWGHGLLHATALMFVAYTGYGRIATLGEEIRDPARSIPRAIVITLLTTMALYIAIAFVVVVSVDAAQLAAATDSSGALLEVVAQGFDVPGIPTLVVVGAITAMVGVLLNLLLGLSRVLLAMSRRGDMPRGLSQLEGEQPSPRRAVIVVGVIIGGLSLIGSIKTTWSFSAFTVLVYYALTNLAALRLPAESRLFPRWVPACGLLSCVGLAFWVEPMIWLAGLVLIGVGLIWHACARRVRASH
ncbi:MAG: APA family basic amino acid/polyamine antiporter [Planctomycetota bacterium]|jgi:APA family basic amino acid/polyamine antiporter